MQYTLSVTFASWSFSIHHYFLSPVTWPFLNSNKSCPRRYTVKVITDYYSIWRMIYHIACTPYWMHNYCCLSNRSTWYIVFLYARLFRPNSSRRVSRIYDSWIIICEMFCRILFDDDAFRHTFLLEARKITNKLLMSRNLRFLKVDQKRSVRSKKLESSYFKAGVFLLLDIW